MNVLHVGNGTLCAGTLLAIGQEQGFFAKPGLDVRPVLVSGTNVPDLTEENPAALIGAPAALLCAAAGTPLKILGAVNTARCVGHLVASGEINQPDDLRGKRFGVRAPGAGQWIQTVLALAELRLNLQCDSISMVAIGGQTDLACALEANRIDAAILFPMQSCPLAAKGFSVLLDLYDAEIEAFPDVLAVHTSLLAQALDQVQALVIGLAETMAFSLCPENEGLVMRTISKGFRVTDPAAAAAGYQAFLRTATPRPYRCVQELRDVQRVMALHDSNVLGVQVQDIVDSDIVRCL